MSSARASAKQAAEILALVNETGWNRDEVQRRIIGRWGLLRDIAVALDDPQLSEEQVRAMHPLFYKKDALPTEITLDGVTYEVLSFLQEGEDYVLDDMMVARAKEMGANLGEEDCVRFVKKQSDIPPVFRRRVQFAFPDYRDPIGRLHIACVYWGNGGWCQGWRRLDYDWDDGIRLLRRKARGENAK
jgi:hypothetical protein